MARQGSLTEGGRLSTVDLLRLDPLIFKLKILFIFLTKLPTLIRRSTVLCLPTQLVFPGKWFIRLSLAHINLIDSDKSRIESMTAHLFNYRPQRPSLSALNNVIFTASLHLTMRQGDM